jgi:lipopolysaccharide transport system permease protein
MNGDFDLIIEPGKGIKQYWADLWRYRELFYFLARRDILVRYKQTVIGVAERYQTALTMAVFSVILQAG